MERYMADEGKLGTTRGTWWWMGALLTALLVAAVIVVFMLIRNGDLARLWAYPALFVGILTAVGFRVLTIVKTVAEEKRD
jgi:hypothetical protein